MSCVLPFCIFLLAVMKEASAVPCSRARAAARAAGALGTTGLFPWLGVLRVHLHEEGGMKLALTGIVLVRDNYALGHADDIARIPKRIFQQDSRAMFIPRDGEPWYCQLVDYLTHPEYQIHTLSTLAILELSMEGLNQFPVAAVCWPPVGYNATTHLYAIGYTDENQALEKFIHRVEHVEADLCKEFYDRAALVERHVEPVQVERHVEPVQVERHVEPVQVERHVEPVQVERHVEPVQVEHKVEPVQVRCVHAPDNKQHCVWDTGLVLASNSTGHWLLLGLGLHGPGCFAPARFVSLLDYFPWIETATAPSVEGAAPAWRRTAFNIGFRPHVSALEVRDVPAHTLQGLLPADTLTVRRQGLDPPQHTKHEFAHYYPHDMVLLDPFYIQRIDGTRIDILPARGKSNNMSQGVTTRVQLPFHEELPRLTALEQFLSSTPYLGTKIDRYSAAEWTKVLSRGIDQKDKDVILQEYLIPYNCKLLQAPRLNTEVSTTLPVVVKNRDLLLAKYQQQLGAGITAVNRGLDNLIKREHINRVKWHLKQACHILADLHYQLTTLRVKLMRPSIDKFVFSVIYDGERGDSLFGDALQKVAVAKALSKQRLSEGEVVVAVAAMLPSTTELALQAMTESYVYTDNEEQ